VFKSVWIKAAAIAAVGLVSAASPSSSVGAEVAAAATASPAGEWPKWLGPKGDGISPAAVADKWPAEGPKKLWSAKVGTGYASAVAADGKVYAFGLDGNQDVLTALEADTGKQLWREAYAGGYDKRGNYPGVRATPTIDGDRIYTYGGAGILVARDLKTGKELWKLDVPKAAGSTDLLTWGQASSPLVRGDHVVVQAGVGGAIAVAVAKADGKVAWLSEAKGTGGYAYPLALDVGSKPQLVVFAGSGLFGMDPATGKTLWQQPWKAEYDVVAATPVTDGKGNVFVTAGYGSGSGAMFQVTPSGAKKLWQKKELRCKFPAPILDGDTLYLVTDEGRGPVKAMKWPTGEILWELKEAKLGFGGSLLRVGTDKLVAQAQTGELYLIQATPKAGKVLSTFKAFEDTKEAWAMPIAYQGKLYAKGPDELVCYELK
jgi:outer membrane protein assembly factor BamB